MRRSQTRVTSRVRVSNLNPYFIIGAILCAVYILVLGFHVAQNLLTLQKRDRINIVLFGESPVVVSFGLSDSVNYMVNFDPEQKVIVPGGYGRYAIGALGRLSEVEKNSAIIQRTFSSMISSHVHYYFLPKKNTVFTESEPAEYFRSHYLQILFSNKYETNANFVNKVYLAWLIAQKKSSDFISLHTFRDKTKTKENIYSEKSFQKKYRGFLYQKALREEANEVKILYVNYRSAVTASRVIEGEGIRVVDFTEDPHPKKGCTILHSQSKKTYTMAHLAEVFHCTIEKGDTEGSDIILIMGEDLSSQWE